jgi:hypothetical protein
LDRLAFYTNRMSHVFTSAHRRNVFRSDFRASKLCHEKPWAADGAARLYAKQVNKVRRIRRLESADHVALQRVSDANRLPASAAAPAVRDKSSPRNAFADRIGRIGVGSLWPWSPGRSRAPGVESARSRSRRIPLPPSSVGRKSSKLGIFAPESRRE